MKQKVILPQEQQDIVVAALKHYQDALRNFINDNSDEDLRFIDFDLTVFNKSLPVPPSCNITLGVTYLGEFYTVYGEPDGGFVQVTYPSSQTATSGSLTYTNNHDVYSFFTVEATPVYPQTFVGWYTQANGSGSLVSTENTLNVTFALQQAYGDTYYANFTGGYIY